MARDDFAERYVAGLFVDDGWNVYFPRRDKGFDFIVTRETEAEVVVRPVQVKGLYPTKGKGDKAVYGYAGGLSLLHPQMVLVLVYFAPGATEGTPQHIAYIQRDRFPVPPATACAFLGGRHAFNRAGCSRILLHAVRIPERARARRFRCVADSI